MRGAVGPFALRVGAVFAVLFLGLATWILGGRPDQRTVDVVLAAVCVAAVATVLIFSTFSARAARGRSRAGWMALAVGAAGAVAGESMWAYRDVLQRDWRFPSVADAAYLMFPLGILAALLLFPNGPARQSKSRTALDGVIVAGSLLIVSWVTVMESAYAGTTGGVELAVVLAYPLINLVVLTMAAVALTRAGDGRHVALTLLTLGLLCMTLAESVFAYLSVDGPHISGNVVVLVWIAGVLLIGLAAVEGRRIGFEPSTADQAPGWASVWLPYAPLMLAATILATQPSTALREHPVLVAGSILIPAVLLRQFLAVAENRRLVAAVAAQALHDPLTGLANRALFDERLTDAVVAARDSDTPAAVLLLDMDDFKLVNDNLGHARGDDVLIATADRIRDNVGPGELVARLGGDEFAVLTRGTSRAVEQTATRLMSGFDAPFSVGGQQFYLQPTIGFSASEPGDTAAELLQRADTAMYAGKRAGGGGVHIFRTGMQTGQPAAGPSPLQAVTELRRAIERGRLTVVYQPKFNLRTSAVVGVEALVRWPHPERGVLLPGEFLPLVREHGLMASLTDLVLGQALDDLQARQREGLGVPVAVNFFGPSLADPDLPAAVSRALSSRGLQPAQLTVELTEALPPIPAEPVAAVLKQLRDMGVRVSLDDFGSGCSQLSDLCRFPVDEVKLDDRFIGALLVDPRAASIVKAVTGLTAELGLSTVAEGVGKPEMVRRLLEFGCEEGQGDFFSPPLPAGELARFLRERLQGAVAR